MKRVTCSVYLSGVVFTYLTWQVLCGTVYKTVLHEGYGTAPSVNQTVIVHYTGTLQTGQKFDSSHDRHQPFKFKLGVGEVIRGWDAGVSSMRVGERARLEIAPEDAYGAEGLPPVIPPSAKLIFDIELLGIEGLDQPPPNTGRTTSQQKDQQHANRQVSEFQGAQPVPPPLGQDFSGSTNNQGQILTPPNLPPVQFTGSTLRQDQVFPPSQQQQSRQQEPQFNGVQGQPFVSNQPQVHMFGTQNQLIQSNPVGNTQRMSSRSMNQMVNPELQTQQLQTIQPPVNTRSGFATNSVQSFRGPSQDISLMNPVLSQASQNQNNAQTFQPAGNQNLLQVGIQTAWPDSFGPQQPRSRQQFQSDIRAPSVHENLPTNNNNFRSRRFEPEIQTGALAGQTTRSRVPDLGVINRQSVDLRQRMTINPIQRPSRQESLGQARDRGPSQPVGVAGMRNMRFDGFRDFADRQTPGRIDPGFTSRGEVGLGPSLPDAFSSRDFRTGTRNLGRNIQDGLRSRDRSFRDMRMRDSSFDRFTDFDPRLGRGIDYPPGLRRDRFLLERARRGRFRPPF